jgi:hypothetical protein
LEGRNGGASDVAERVADATIYGRLRAFLEDADVGDRRLTAEWLAGRLGIPLRLCTAALDELATEGIVHRHKRPEEPPWFDLTPPARSSGVRRLVLGLAVVLLCASVVAAGAMLHHIFWFVLGIAIGLMIAFAWLDWELRGRV